MKPAIPLIVGLLTLNLFTSMLFASSEVSQNPKQEITCKDKDAKAEEKDPCEGAPPTFAKLYKGLFKENKCSECHTEENMKNTRTKIYLDSWTNFEITLKGENDKDDKGQPKEKSYLLDPNAVNSIFDVLITGTMPPGGFVDDQTLDNTEKWVQELAAEIKAKKDKAAKKESE